MSKALSFKWISFAFAVVIGVVVLLSLPSWAKANPSLFMPFKANAVASTSAVYMTPGTATSTITYDTATGANQKADKATVVFQVTATSSVPSKVLVRIEDSRDGIDWYTRTIAGTTATTTLMTSDPYNALSFAIATSSTALGASASVSRTHQSFTVETPLRFIRAVFYDPSGGGNYAVYAEVIPYKEKP